MCHHLARHTPLQTNMLRLEKARTASVDYFCDNPKNMLIEVTTIFCKNSLVI